MRNHSVSRPVRGFSLIEVLIAVVILSVGLLALASLQVNLIRSSSDTKAQSIAMGLAKQRLEQLLSFKATGGTDTTCTSPAGGGNNTCYRMIDSISDTPTAGGVSFTRLATVTRYVYNKSLAGGVPTGFVQYGSNTALDSALLTSPVTYLAGKEFKRIVMTVTWTDATNTSNTIKVEDAIAAVNPADSAAVSKTGKGTVARKAKSIITNPGTVSGVIPIAIGNGSDTAATNPRPIITGQGGNTTVTETRFDVYTYAALSGNTALAQSRVETSVIGCTCTMTNQTQDAARPTYWDGYAYTTPETASGIPVSAPASGNSITQSDLCTDCCRDHQDPSGVTGAKFDSRRSTHSHYLSTDLATVVDTDHPGNYNEACRLIRVDGVFRVAPDTYADDLSQLATAGLTKTTSTTTVVDAVPGTGSGSMSETYQNYVLSYLSNRFVTGTNYNTPLAPSTVTPTTYYTTMQLPATATIDTGSTPKYLHVRGLYIDYLSAEAIAAITTAKTDCAASNAVLLGSCSDTDLQTSILKLLPFTSINTTELANWTSQYANKIEISNNGFKSTIDDPLPVRGKSTLKSGAATGDTTIATSTIQRSSAGLAVTNNVFPSSALTAYASINGGGNDYDGKDTQNFLVGSGSVIPDPNAGSFSVALAGNDLLTKLLTVANPADVRFTLGLETTCNLTTSGTVQPYICYPNSGQTLGGSIPVKVGNYNREFTATVGNACKNSPGATTSFPYRKLVTVTSANVNGTAATTATFNSGVTGSIASGGEYTVVTANPLTNNAVVTLNFSSVSYTCPTNWSTYITNAGAATSNGNGQTFNNWVDANCSGSGNNVAPNWSTTYSSSCPSSISPFNGQ